MFPFSSHTALKYTLLFGMRGGYQDTDFLEYLNPLMKEGWVVSGNFIGDIGWNTPHLRASLEIDTREISEATLEEREGESYFVDVRLKKSYLINELYIEVLPLDWLDIYLGKKSLKRCMDFYPTPISWGWISFLTSTKIETSPSDSP